ncbi:Homeobox-leucine zipper protein HAT3 [Hibiscus syriacus]|uniref:Homeobox-leucine zipper protein HAT3 n=1 Tax=Hibiscus syriacus TaxID=106335 RepID=A0A6A2XUY7_HIBSY|nr:Homeobox-leucine zipper protein HAT3 [Hibiscus syriacus]
MKVIAMHADGNLDTRSFLLGIDVNRAPAMVDCEEEGGASDDENGAAGDASRKKLRLSKEQSLLLEETFKEHSTLNPKQKLALAKELNMRPRQVEVWFQNRRARIRCPFRLKKIFKGFCCCFNCYMLNSSLRFNGKLKQTEVDCEYLKRCCENLTEENLRLQKEVQGLRALKLSPQLYMHMNPPTTLTMCPSCERVVASFVINDSSSVAPSSVPSPTSAIPNQQRLSPVSPWQQCQLVIDPSIRPCI